MILIRLLWHELHRARGGIQPAFFWIDNPTTKDCVPAIISSSRGKFIVSRKLTHDGKLRSGVFKYDSDRMDDLIGDMMEAAFTLSRDEKWPNVFEGPGALARGFTHVQHASGMKTQPHVCLIPEKLSTSELQKLFGKDLKDGIYRKVCRLVPCKVLFPIMCSRPDFVGMYTQFVGGQSSILLHNVKNGLAFCPPLGEN